MSTVELGPTGGGTRPGDPAPWSPPPAPLPLPVDALHVFAFDLHATDAALARYLEILSPEEQQRAGRYRFARHHRRFVAGRAQLRQVLGTYLGCGAADVGLCAEARGRPVLVGEGRIRFSVSGSGDLALGAFRAGADVGVDVERLRPFPGCAAVVERFFSPEERRAWSRVAIGDHDHAFFRCWTRKEALVKSTGRGLAYPLETFAVPFEVACPREPVVLAGEGGAATRWLLPIPDPRPGYVAAVAVGGGPCDVACWTWQG